MQWGLLVGSKYKMESLSAIREGKSRVCADSGAGLELSPSIVGYSVDEIDPAPGQPDLEVGDVILAVGGSLLVGLDEEEIEARFGSSHCDDAQLLIGSGAALQDAEVAALGRAAGRFLSQEVHPVTKPRTSLPLAGPCGHDADGGLVVCEEAGLVSHGEAEGEAAKPWLGARGRIGILHGAYQLELQLQEECLVRVGWATANDRRRRLGLDDTSFGYGGTGKKSTGGSFEPYGEEFQSRVGAVLTCLIDRRNLPLIREGKLRVSGDSGAGLQLGACEFGYVVDEILLTPSQPDLQLGDVILAVGGLLLLGLEEDEIEARFGSCYFSEAQLLICSLGALQGASVDDLARAAQRLLGQPRRLE